ncbi:hypothetical protein FRZ61_01490 [Hypericibacter adhaerens]|jgi:hypothetical protein|uniref:Uncharacterized protein n=1 Tax=Hypericibacter adhaerens TaxID=2602016 RepID=A0A5J6MSD1_9PROT|nr:hypothetical protein [Hypericibacter adhaerens]QEX20233.1 hypothetical protein FRZ61_01490 [Hypericibacter adhaerens]
MRNQARRVEPADSTQSHPASGKAAVVQPAGKSVGLQVVIKAVTKSGTGRRRRRTVESAPADEASLDNLAQLLIRHLESDLKDILK